MQSKPLISIIIPTYNAEAYLDETLASVFAQTYSNWECIIVNDGSTDKSAQIAQKWVEKDPRFRIIHKENNGLSRARNTGIENANADYIAFLDSDDIWMPKHLSLTMKKMLVYQPDIVYSYGYQLRNGTYTNSPTLGITAQALNKDGVQKGKITIESFLQTNKITPSFTLCKKQCLIENQNFSYYKKAEDYHTWLKLLFNKCIFYCINKPTGYYRVVEDSLSSIDRTSTKESVEIISLFKDRFSEFNINYNKYFTLWAKRYFLLKSEKEHYIETIHYINSLEKGCFSVWKKIAHLFPNKILKLITLQLLNFYGK